MHLDKYDEMCEREIQSHQYAKCSTFISANLSLCCNWKTNGMKAIFIDWGCLFWLLCYSQFETFLACFCLRSICYEWMILSFIKNSNGNIQLHSNLNWNIVTHVQQQQQKWIFQPIIKAVTSVLVTFIYVAYQTIL